jgi:NADH-quinone oxidoreductase subunit N
MNPELIEQLFDARAMTALGPLMALAAGGVLLLMADILPVPRALRGVIVLLSLGFAAGLETTIFKNPPGAVLMGSLQADATTAVWGLLFLFATLIAWLFAQRYYDEEQPLLAEHDVLMLTSASGMMLMAGAQDLLVFFIGLELLSIPLYALAGFRRSRNASVEAGLKYFILGAFGAALFLYGAALLYSDTGTIRLEDLRATGAGTPLAVVGVALIVASLLFKVGVVPFHMWVPDVYQGSPTPVTALMVTGTKAAGFAFLLNASFLLPESAAPTLAILAIVTMAVGNLGALVQTDMKRLLAYSGIAHAGVLLLAVTGGLAGDPVQGGAVQAALFYSAAYVFTAGGAFGLIAALEVRTGRTVDLDSLRGLAKRSPGAAAAMALFMLSLGGIPATGGFLGKYLVFSVLVRADLIAVAVIAVLLSVVALGYYLRVVVAMYMQEETEEQPATATQMPAAWIAGACAAVVVLLGVLPGWLLERI